MCRLNTNKKSFTSKKGGGGIALPQKTLDEMKWLIIFLTFPPDKTNHTQMLARLSQPKERKVILPQKTPPQKLTYVGG